MPSTVTKEDRMSRAEQKLAEQKKVCVVCQKGEMCNAGKILNRIIFSEKNLR